MHYNLLEVMVLRNKNPPVYAVTFIFILQGTFHYNFTVFFMKCNNIYIYVEFNPVAIFCNVSTQMGIAAKWIEALLSIENKNRQTEMTISMNTKKLLGAYILINPFIILTGFIVHLGIFVQTTIKEVFRNPLAESDSIKKMSRFSLVQSISISESIIRA
ncbi:hypothetical protein J4733_16200 [Klebsiella pneumoniae]|uniref:Uncharacterized protein n=1 Tax=Klebsiella pneumoniae TaxID=573 RepID=A0A939SPJ3_KLEPN|nr:hypothetical protein [Klebsiella pneumoniae]